MTRWRYSSIPVVLLAIFLTGCGDNAPATSHDRLLMLTDFFPDSGATRVEVDIASDSQAAMAPTASSPGTGVVAATATLRSQYRTITMAGTYDLGTNNFHIAYRHGFDSLTVDGGQNITGFGSPVAGGYVYSGPPLNRGDLWGVRDTTGRAAFYCITSHFDQQKYADRHFGFIATDSLLIGVGGGLEVPFKGLVKRDSLHFDDAATSYSGTLAPDRNTASGTFDIGGILGTWSAYRC